MAEGEVIGESRSERFHAAERRIARMSHVLDDLFEVPGTGRRVGLDPLVGLIPVVGDVVSAAAGAYLIAEASRFRLPRSSSRGWSSTCWSTSRWDSSRSWATCSTSCPSRTRGTSRCSGAMPSNRRRARPSIGSSSRASVCVMLGLIWLVVQAVAWLIGLLLTPIRP